MSSEILAYHGVSWILCGMSQGHQYVVNRTQASLSLGRRFISVALPGATAGRDCTTLHGEATVSWSTPTSFGEVVRRASGRRVYNALRRDLAVFRRLDVARLLSEYGPQRGVQARIARELRGQ